MTLSGEGGVTIGFQHTDSSNFFSANVNDFGLVDFILKMCISKELTQ